MLQELELSYGSHLTAKNGNMNHSSNSLEQCLNHACIALSEAVSSI